MIAVNPANPLLPPLSIDDALEQLVEHPDGFTDEANAYAVYQAMGGEGTLPEPDTTIDGKPGWSRESLRKASMKLFGEVSK